MTGTALHEDEQRVGPPEAPPEQKLLHPGGAHTAHVLDGGHVAEEERERGDFDRRRNPEVDAPVDAFFGELTAHEERCSKPDHDSAPVHAEQQHASSARATTGQAISAIPVPSPAKARPTSRTANAGAIAPMRPPSPMQIEAERALQGIPSRSSAAEPTSENAAIAMKKTDVISPASLVDTSNSLATGAAAGPTTPAP